MTVKENGDYQNQLMKSYEKKQQKLIAEVRKTVKELATKTT